MADRDLTSPLLSSPPPSGQPEFIINVHGDDSRYGQRLTNDSQNRDQRDYRNSDRYDSRNPYDFLGSRELSVPRPITIDPFRNATPKIDGLYEVLKIVLCLPIALLRLILFGLSLAIGYIATWLALKGWKDKENPMPKWRCWIMWVTRFSARCILFSFGYQWIRRKGKPAPRKIAPIVVSNHVSYIEPIFYFYELFPTIVASESHDSMPFVGTIIRAMQVIYVNRFSQASRKNAVNEIKRKAASDRFPRVLLFPEGTTSNGKVLISFQLGAFIHGYPIQPVVVRYPHVHFDQSWGNVSLLMLMFRMFTQFHNFMEIEYLPVIFPSANKKESAVHFAERTSRAIATALNVVQTSHSYGDVLLLTRALELKLENPNNYTVEMATLCNVSSLEAVEFLDVFVSMNPDSRGRVTLHGFLRALRLKPCAVSEAIFRFIDVEKTGSITFKQFLFGSAHILKQPLFLQACELAFSESDANGDGFVSEQELKDSVRRAIPDMNKDEVHGLFDLLDADRDQNISHNDFLSSLRRNPFLIAVFAPRNIQQELVQCIS